MRCSYPQCECDGQRNPTAIDGEQPDDDQSGGDCSEQITMGKVKWDSLLRMDGWMDDS